MADEEQVPTFYASGVSIGVTPWDLTMIIAGRAGPTPKDVHPIANIIFSPQHALILSKILAREIDNYQRTVGKIELPPRLLNDLGLEP
jgi:hypothetical protein